MEQQIFQTVKELAPRQKELEAMFRKYPDHPHEAVIKADCLSKGVAFTEDALKVLENARRKSYCVSFSQDSALISDMKQREAFRVPEDVMIQGGTYGLRPTWFELHINPESPYVFDVIEGKLMLCTDHTALAPAETPPTPEYYKKTFEDGVPYYDIIAISGGCVMAYISCLRNCQYFGDNEECKFCDINANVKQQHEAGRPYTVVKPLDRVAVVAKELVAEANSDPARLPIESIVVSGGTVTKNLHGLVDEEFYTQYVRTIIETVGSRRPIYLQTAAKDKAACWRLKAAGVTRHAANFEVWDSRLFKILCPGKDRFVGRDEWIKRLAESVEVFGVGNVIPTQVEGIEMAQPWGFKDIESGVKSTTEGFDFLMSHGVMPRLTSWLWEPLSYIGKNTPGPHPYLTLEYYMRIERAWHETWKKYHLPVPHGQGPMGPGNARNNGGAYLDVMF